jgi:HAD superfamily hydrolase (TIGR01509 family)
MTQYKGVIFDLDGTLADSMNIWEKIDIDFLAKRGIAVPDDYMHAIAHLGSYETATYTINRFSLSDTPEELIAEWVEMAAEAYKEVSLKPGAFEFLSHLKENNIKICIATATELSLVKIFLESKNIIGYIDHIVTLSDVGIPKEFPDIYNKCAELMDLTAKDCMVFEDLFMAVKGAKSGGYYVVGVYDYYSRKDEEVIRNSCDKFIYDFKEMF